MTKRGQLLAGLTPIALLLAGCGPQVQTAANNPVALYQQGTSAAAVQAREAVGNAQPQQSPAASAPASPAPSAAAPQPSSLAQPMASMAGMSMPASASPSAPAAAPAQPKVYDPVVQPALPGPIDKVTLTAEDGVQEIAPGVMANVMTFDGVAPGPVIHVKQGDTVEFTIKNDGTMQHSIDFHAAETPWNLNYQPVNPGQSFTFSFKADHPGAFMYHCGTAPALMHIGMGMYGEIIVDPAQPLPPAKEYALVQSEFYTKPGAKPGILDFDYAKAQNGKPDYVVFNGVANQYSGDSALTAKPGEPIRLWVVNAGPNDFSAFHVVGAILDKVYPDGNPANALTGMQTYTIPPGGGAMIELTIPAEGWYPVVSHSFADASKGAMAMIKVGNPPPATGTHG